MPGTPAPRRRRPTRLITRNAMSLVLPLPHHLPRQDPADRRRALGAATPTGSAAFTSVRRISSRSSRWSREPISRCIRSIRHRRTRCAISCATARARIVGRKLAETYGFKIGDVVPLRGTIFPGNWEFVVRAIYDGANAKTDTSQFFFHWDYLNETL